MPEGDDARKKRKWTRWALTIGIHAAVMILLLMTDETTYAEYHRLKDSWNEKRFFAFRLLTSANNWRFFASFGIWLAGIALAFVVWRLDTRSRRLVPILATGVILASTLTSVVSKTIGRTRPEEAQGQSHFRPFGQAWRTGETGTLPSGHATFAAAMAAFLALAYPKIKGLGWVMAVGCALSRMFFSKHFPADLYAGLLVGNYVMLGTWRAFDRWWPPAGTREGPDGRRSPGGETDSASQLE